jgi:hypothetical protein
VFVGDPVALPARGDVDLGAGRCEIQAALAAALDAVSVNCPDDASFERVQEAAHARSQRGESFAGAFLEAQRALPEVLAAPPVRRPAWVPVMGIALMWAFWPVLAAAWFAGSRADARNTVTFLRTLGGLAAGVVWLPCIALAAVFWPIAIGAGVVSAAAGWLLLGIPRWRR